jgi:hypothetical protein
MASSEPEPAGDGGAAKAKRIKYAAAPASHRADPWRCDPVVLFPTRGTSVLSAADCRASDPAPADNSS